MKELYKRVHATIKLGMSTVAHFCNQEIGSYFKASPGKKFVRPYLRKTSWGAGRVAQVVCTCLASMGPSSNPRLQNKTKTRLGMVTHACSPIYSGGRDRRIEVGQK
jgi:hypothetical protein